MKEIIRSVVDYTFVTYNLTTLNQLTVLIPCWFNWWPWIIANKGNITTYADLEAKMQSMSLNDFYVIAESYYTVAEAYAPYLIEFLMPWNSACNMNYLPWGVFL